MRLGKDGFACLLWVTRSNHDLLIVDIEANRRFDAEYCVVPFADCYPLGATDMIL